MRRTRISLVRVALVIAGLLLAVACESSSTEQVPAPVVTITGGVAVEVGDTLGLSATTTGGEDSGYTWSSSDEAVATVSETGLVTGVSAGQVVVTATGADTGARGTWGVHVYTVGTGGGTAVVVVGGPVAVEVGDTITLQAQTLEGTDASYTWASSATGVATVDAAGVVTGLAAGEATITATGSDTGAAGSWGVYVYVEGGQPGEPVVVVTGDAGLMVGATVALTARTVNGSDASYAWSSSDGAIATVDAAGVVTGLAAGEALITATGASTQAAGSHGVVVVATSEEPIGFPALDAWLTSGHADASSASFRHWDDSGVVPASCAKCHSTWGYLDFLGDDGSAAGTVDEDAPLGSVVTCAACHSAGATALDSVTFPSGAEVMGLGASARCMECHQGRESTDSVNDHIAGAAPADDDTVTAGLRFRNIHYAPAGATLVGAEGRGGYQYEGMAYDVRFAHVEGFASCVSCHDPHSTQVDIASCNACHEGVATPEDLRAIRMAGSLMDYDGDGDTMEGIAAEIEGLQAALYMALRAYASEFAGVALVYDAQAYPYFFADANDNGVRDEGEAGFSAWTARLVRAAYNYQYALKDPGAYAHNAKYVIQLLFDSIADLNGVLTAPVDMATAQRIDAGHFDGSSGSFRYWDGDGEVRASCARCHSAAGLPEYLATGVDGPAPLSNGLECATCHADLTDLSQIHAVAGVNFPSGMVVDSGSNTSNLCMSCHQGRESGAAVAAAVDGLDPDTVSASLRFRNIHYSAAGATRHGREAGGGFEYEGRMYSGWFAHAPGYTQCADCHDVHTQQLKIDTCGDCHQDVLTEEDLHAIRMAGSTADHDGDGDMEEGTAEELMGLHGALYAALQQYATEIAGAPLAYDAHRYPYFFDSGTGAGYAAWTPRLLQAAYNYQFVAKDPGGYAHNPRYMAQLMFDSLDDLAQAVSIDLSAFQRNAANHFDMSSRSFRYWDGAGAVPAGCARCHSGEAGFLDYLADFANDDAVPPAEAMSCDTCHTGAAYAGAAPRRFVEKVVFPSGVELMNDADNPDDSFLCMTCHQGREAKASVDAAIAAGEPSFRNVHYAPAGAVLYGSAAQVGYQYEGRAYEGRFTHYGGRSAQCASCHDLDDEGHTFAAVLPAGCTGCHGEATAGDVRSIRLSRSHDYDGDGDTTESLYEEIAGLSARLYVALQAVAAANGTPLVYDGGSHPYFFNDTNDNGVGDPDELVRANAFSAWTDALARAAFNYQLAKKDRGAWAHNTDYVGQLLYDAIADLGGDLTGLSRP